MSVSNKELCKTAHVANLDICGSGLTETQISSYLGLQPFSGIVRYGDAPQEVQIGGTTNVYYNNEYASTGDSIEYVSLPKTLQTSDDYVRLNRVGTYIVSCSYVYDTGMNDATFFFQLESVSGVQVLSLASGDFTVSSTDTALIFMRVITITEVPTRLYIKITNVGGPISYIDANTTNRWLSVITLRSRPNLRIQRTLANDTNVGTAVTETLIWATLEYDKAYPAVYGNSSNYDPGLVATEIGVPRAGYYSVTLQLLVDPFEPLTLNVIRFIVDGDVANDQYERRDEIPNQFEIHWITVEVVLYIDTKFHVEFRHTTSFPIVVYAESRCFVELYE